VNANATFLREGGEAGRPGRAAAGADDSVRDAIRAVRRGEVDAYGPVVEQFRRRLFALVLMVTRDAAAAEEVAQDAFVRAFTHLDAYDDRRPFYPWLATIAVRLAQNWLVQRQRAAAHEGSAAVPAQEPGRDALEALIADETGRRLWASVARLPSGERTAAFLYYRQELTVPEVARTLGVTSGTVKTLLFRARQRLRRATAAPNERRGEW